MVLQPSPPSINEKNRKCLRFFRIGWLFCSSLFLSSVLRVFIFAKVRQCSPQYRFMQLKASLFKNLKKLQRIHWNVWWRTLLLFLVQPYAQINSFSVMCGIKREQKAFRSCHIGRRKDNIVMFLEDHRVIEDEEENINLIKLNLKKKKKTLKK